MMKMRGWMVYVLVMAATFSFGQNVVKDLSNVKKPGFGKLYFSKKDSSLNLWVGKWKALWPTVLSSQPAVTPPSDTVTVPPPMDEVEIGYWAVPERVLVSKMLAGKYYLMQTDATRSYYVPRGKNLLTNTSTKIKANMDLGVIESGNSDLGGLFKPGNFPETEFKKLGYTINGNNEYVKITDNGPPPTENGAGLVTLDLTADEKRVIANNSFDWHKFGSLTLPKGHLAVLGYGSPIYNTGLKNGKLPYFDAGWTHAVNVERLPMNYWSAKDKAGQWESPYTYYFQQYSHLANHAAQQASAWWKPEWGDLSGLWNGNYGLDYSRINDEGAVMLGKIIGGNNSVARNNETGEWNVKTRGNYLMMDEEEFSHYPNYWSFLGKIAEGITEANPELNVMLYGPASSYFIHTNNWTEKLSDAKIEDQLKNGWFSFNNSGFKKSKTIFDLSMGYYKVPGIETNSKYLKLNGAYALKNGKRVYRTDNVTENYYGKKVLVLGEPHEWLKYNLTLKDPAKMDNGSGIYKDLFGKQYFDGIGVVKSPYSTLYKDNSRKPNEWLSEAEYAVRQEYKYVNGALMKMLIINREEFGDYNLNDYRNRKLQFGVVRRWCTEPFTDYGNHIERREIGPDLVFWDVAFSYVAGITALEAWEDGLYLNSLPESGQQLYGEDDNYGRFETATRALQKVFKPFEGLPVENTKFLHFYRPFKSENNAEAIVVARYNGTKMVLVARNPTLDPDEKQILKLSLKGKDYTINLDGNKTRLVQIEVPAGLKPEEAILEQTSIYGLKVVRNGVSTWRVN